MRLLLAVAALVLASGQAFAACTSPAGEAGEIIFNTTHSVVQVCNGTNWVGLGGNSNSGETDPQVGSITDGKWCTASGGVVTCASDAPLASVALDGLTDVTITTAVTGNVLHYNGTGWVNTPIADLVASGDRIVSGTTGLIVSGTTSYLNLNTGGVGWGYLSSGTSYLPTLAAATLSATTTSGTYHYGQYASFTSLVVGGVSITGSGVGAMASLTDVTFTTAPAQGQFLQYVSGKWRNVSTSDLISGSQVAFSVHRNEINQTVPANAWTKVSFTTVAFDTTSSFNTSTSRFTPNVPGKYIVTSAIYCQANGSTECNLQIRKNGSVYSYAYESTGYGQPVITNIVDLNGTTDYLEVFAYNKDGTVLNFSSGISFFQGALINAFGTAASGGSTASGDAITSGTTTALVNSATTYISLTTGATTWGYLSSGTSVLPTISATTLSGTYAYGRYASFTTALVGTIGAGNIAASGYVSATNASFTTMSLGPYTFNAAGFLASATTTMESNWPDAITCSHGGGYRYLYHDWTSASQHYYTSAMSDASSNLHYVIFNSSGTQTGGGNVGNCAGTSISALTAAGRTFNFIGGSSSSSSAQGDRITSGTTTALVNSATTYISLSTGATTWGYLSSATSVLPTISATTLSATNLYGRNLSATTATLGTIGADNIAASGYVSASNISAVNASFTALSISGTNITGAMPLYSCPSGFTFIQSQGRALGCMQNTTTAGSWRTGSQACYANYGGRLPSLSEFHIAANNYTLSNETGAWQALDDGSDSNQILVVGNATIYDTSYGPNSTVYTYRCFIPATGIISTTTITNLSDVSVSAATTGQVLSYNGSAWVPSNTAVASSAQGDRITSGTAAVIARNNADISLTSSIDVSGTIKFAGTGAETCGLSTRGTMRINPVDGALQICRPTN